MSESLMGTKEVRDLLTKVGGLDGADLRPHSRGSSVARRGTDTSLRQPRTPPGQLDPKPPRAGGNRAPVLHGHAQILAASLNIDLFCRTLAHEAPDAIIFADVGGMIRFWNHGAERVFGYTAPEALGRSLDIIMPKELRPRHWDAYGVTMRTGQTHYGAGEVLAVPGMRKDGSTVPIEFTLLPFHDREGRVLGVAAILRDATRHVAEIEALRSELTAAREATTES